MSWQKVKLGSISSIRYGLGQPPELDELGVPMIRATNIKQGQIVSDGVIRVKRTAIPAKRNPFLKPGDILVVRSGVYTGAAAMYDGRWEEAIAGYDLVVSPSTEVDPAFLAKYLLTNSVQSYFEGQSHRSAQAHLNSEQLSTTPIILPPIAEQKAIAHTLQTIQQAKEARQRELALERERKAALMQDLFIYGTCGERQKLTEIGDIPESWKVVELGDVCTVSSGGTPSREKPEYWNGDIPWVKTGEISYNVITKTEEKISRLGLTNSAAKIIPSGTLLMAMYGQGVTRGRVAILGIDATINQACAAISTPAHISTEFLFYWLAHNYERIRLLGHGANQKNLNALIVKSIPIVLPAYEEQCVIAETLQACDRKIMALENEVSTLNELFYTMLENLMSGHLPVTCR